MVTDQPEWLRAGAEVLVRGPGGEKACTVVGVEWPWLVFLELERGGVHPRNVRPAPSALEPMVARATQRSLFGGMP